MNKQIVTANRAAGENLLVGLLFDFNWHHYPSCHRFRNV